MIAVINYIWSLETINIRGSKTSCRTLDCMLCAPHGQYMASDDQYQVTQIFNFITACWINHKNWHPTTKPTVELVLIAWFNDCILRPKATL